MSEKRASLEKIAPTVEEAVANGLADLGLAEDAVEIEILDEGSKGLFGLGSRQARVRLTIKSSASPAAEPDEQEDGPHQKEERGIGDQHRDGGSNSHAFIVLADPAE